MEWNADSNSEIPFDDAAFDAEAPHFNWLQVIGMHFPNFREGILLKF